jgi:uncharacterized hydrophobic protein (TIGR00341 family)
MGLRLLEVVIPEDELPNLSEELEDLRVIRNWTASLSDGLGIGRFLLDSTDTEALSDRLVNRYGERDCFQLMLYPVVATLPAQEVEKQEESDANGEEKGESPDPAAERVSREELASDLNEASRLTFAYLTMVGLSTVVAAVGLVRGDVTLLIGAMVIAPLLGPNIALSLACTLGDMALARRSMKAIAAGMCVAATISFLIGLAVPIDPTAKELASRATVSQGDVLIALAAGAAGSIAFTTGVPAVLVGVMVAVALLPPLVAAGLFAGSGHMFHALEAMALLTTNVTCVNLAAIATFFFQKVRPRTWWEADRAAKATRAAVTIWLLLLVLLVGVITYRGM